MADNLRGYGGFRWVRTMAGGGPPSALPYRVASGYTGAINGGTTIDINLGDPVRLVNTGTVAHAAGNEAAGNAAEDIMGIVVGFMPYYDGTRRVFGTRLPANTVYGSVMERASYVLVYPAAGNVWEIDADDSTTATTEAGYLAFIGENCDHRLTTGSEPKTNCLLDISTHVATTAQWRILDVPRFGANQDFSGNYVKLLVTCNETQQAPFVTAGI